LKRGSIRVAEGDTVRPGDLIAECGNSGNSSEPHVHMQLMDRPEALIAAGLPVTFERFEIDGEPRDGVPDKSRPFVARLGR
ncbi:MAG: M23 family metallopeptidase, partial [Solirubrobacterales bacterium]